MFRAVDVQLLPSNPSVDAHELTCAENASASIIDISQVKEEFTAEVAFAAVEVSP